MQSTCLCAGYRPGESLWVHSDGVNGKSTFHRRSNLSWLSKICYRFGEIAAGSQWNRALFYGQKKNKISARPPAAASARIAPKICQGQLRTICSEFPKFHPNPFTSGGVIAERANIVQTRHKVFAILGEASASSPSNNFQTTKRY